MSRYHRIITPLTDFVRQYNWYIATALITLMFGLGFFSMIGQSAIVDEVAHIPAAYSYDHFGDYRLNPEHPPLMKDLAGLPLQFMHLQFPSNEPAWTTDVNGEFNAGWDFIYNLGNNANAVLFWARLPILLVAVGFGFALYSYVKRHWGIATGLLALLFYTLSPNIIAHARYVTTDVGASVTIFIALVTFVRYIRHPDRRNFVLLSLALALANLAKFNSVLLYPFLFLMALIATFVNLDHSRIERFKQYVGGFIVASALSLVWIYFYYVPNVMHMPTSVQDRLITGTIKYGPALPLTNFLVAMSHVPLAKPLVQYLLGVTLVFGRVEGGNVTFFNGMITNGSFHGYFPELFVLKTQVALLILMLLTGITGFAWWLHGRPSWRLLRARWAASLRTNLAEWTLGLFAVFYFAVAVNGNLDLGIRHILPVYLPIFVVVAVGTIRLARRLETSKWRVWSAAGLTILVAWYALSTILAYPNYTSYFNEIIGGGGNAGNYFSDSSVDWGQSLLQLKSYVDKNHITTFALDYFGGGDPDYVFCNRSYDINGKLIATAAGYDCSHTGMIPWHSMNGRYTGQYIAVSETYLENDRYYAALGQEPGYTYLRAMKPIAKVGNSIYVFKLY